MHLVFHPAPPQPRVSVKGFLRGWSLKPPEAGLSPVSPAAAQRSRHDRQRPACRVSVCKNLRPLPFSPPAKAPVRAESRKTSPSSGSGQKISQIFSDNRAGTCNCASRKYPVRTGDFRAPTKDEWNSSEEERAHRIRCTLLRPQSCQPQTSFLLQSIRPV